MHEPHSLMIIYTTLPDEKVAHEIAAGLIEKRLASCVNAVPGLTSFFRWDNQVTTAGEIAIFVKTRVALRSEVLAFIKEKHPYEVPALLTFTPTQVSADYMNWCLTETEADHSLKTKT